MGKVAETGAATVVSLFPVVQMDIQVVHNGRAARYTTTITFPVGSSPVVVRETAGKESERAVDACIRALAEAAEQGPVQ